MNKQNQNIPNRKILLALLCFLFIGGVYAVTTISDVGVTTPEVNNVLYVQAGNETDLRLKINQSRDSGGGLVMVPEGTYNIVNTINLSGDVIVKGYGVSTIIKPTGDFDVFLMCGDYTRVENLEVNTEVAGYNSSAFAFVEECPERSNWLYITNVKIVGNKDTLNTDKAISLIDDASGGPGITWVLIKNVRIQGYRYGIYLETNHATAYVKGNSFININFVETNFAIYENMTLGSGSGIEGNTFDVRMNGDPSSEYFAHIEGDREYFYSIVFDAELFNSNNIAYNITSGASRTYIVDPLLQSKFVNDSGSESVYYMSDKTILERNINMTKTIEFHFSGSEAIEFYNNNAQKRMSIDYDNTNIGLLLKDRNGNNIMEWDEGGQVIIDKGNLNMSSNNITMKSNDGTEFNCGVLNSGAFVCS